MKVAEVMTRNVELVPPEATVRDAATLMAEHDIGAIPVGSEDHLVGILTDRDIILRVVIPGKDAGQLRVGEVMSAKVFTCTDEETVETALQTMDEHQVRRLPVIDAQGRVVGIIVRGDLAHRLLDARSAAAEPSPQPELDAPTPLDGP